ncbi:PREDICTED: chymotrypsin-2-like isoform X1 [Ceratosolen solmsi marchali]|uniref:Chymotrypsin-2-like isoform X1 n=1 Tax=Ceratosolen solmsi marchali TaxID=326594 RepID=A0AAJ6YKK5_9HYME|nr:PREDICTED: chymotrypsin-2-like isoform X1 [Ceratosolen solmsi marchali]
MQYKKTLLLLLRYILIYKQCNFLLVNGLIGANVREAEINEFSSAVAIVKIVPDNSWPENNFKCSATLISYRDVLTCAHCVENEEVDQVKVLVGMNNLRDGIEHLPLWWVTYDEWAEQNGVASLFPVNDLCIIRLARNVSINHATPSRIVRISRDRLQGRRVHLATWGTVMTGRIPRMMQTVSLNIYSNQECSNRYTNITHELYRLPLNYLCTAATPFALISPGDSGGGLYLDRNTIIAVTKSVSPSFNFYHQLSVNTHTFLYFYRDFIRLIVQHSI